MGRKRLDIETAIDDARWGDTPITKRVTVIAAAAVLDTILPIADANRIILQLELVAKGEGDGPMILAAVKCAVYNGADHTAVMTVVETALGCLQESG